MLTIVRLALISALLLLSGAAFAAPLELKVAKASVVNDSADQKALSLELTPQSREAFGAFTAEHVGQTIDLRIDGDVVMSPRLVEPITGGKIMVSGTFEPGKLAEIGKRIIPGGAKVEVEAQRQ
jgi:preprotein translocase subunit SecD